MAVEDVGVRLKLAGKQKFTGDMKGAAGDVKNLGDKVDQASEKARKSADRWRTFGRVAAGATAAAGAALASLAVSSVKSASALEQSVGGVQSVFGAASGTVLTFASDAAQSVGLAKSEYATLAAVVGSQLQRMGQSQADSAIGTDKLITLGADLAATYGGSVADAVGAVGSLLRGERDPIERYAVGIKQSDINARLAADGLGRLEGAAKTQAESQATLALLFAQTANAQGAFGRESDTLAGTQERLRAQIEDVKAGIGEALLPAMVAVATFLNTTAVPAIQAFVESARGSGSVRAEFTGIGDSVQKMAPAFQTFSAELPSLGQSLSLVSGVLGFLASHTDTVIRLMPYLVAAFVAFKTAQLAANAAAAISVPLRIAEVLANRALVRELRAVAAAQIGQTVTATANAVATGTSTVATRTSTTGLIANRLATIAQTVAGTAAAAATRIWAAGQWLLNAALSANPMGLVIIGVAALVAGVVIAYQKSETFRGAVDKLWGALKKVAEWAGKAWDKIKGMGEAIQNSAVGRFVGGLFGGGEPEGRAGGGPVNAGQSYIVGERRPELFVPDVSGFIVPKVPNTIRPGLRLPAQQAPQALSIGNDGGSLMGDRQIVVKTYLDGRQIAESQAVAVADHRARQ